MPGQGHSKIPLDLAAVRARLEKEKGKRLWRSLEELAESPEYLEFLQNEFPHDPAKDEGAGCSRRDVLKLMAASAALAGLNACTKLPTEKIVPYVQQPEEIIPGKPLFYATSMTQHGVAQGLLVESHMGRPTKVEGNPDHPASLGATDLFAQASVLTLYDPDRSQAVRNEGRIADWELFVQALNPALAEQALARGAGLRILTETIASPSLAAQLREVLSAFPGARWHQYEPCGRDNSREAARLAFGEYANAVYRFDRADVILSLDADFLCAGPGGVRYARDFANGRDLSGGRKKMNRLYVAESTPSITGAAADHRVGLRNGEVAELARLIAAKIGLQAGSGAAPGVPGKWIEALVRDLEAHRGASLVLAGEYQSPAVQALAHAMNHALGNAGRTVYYTDALEAQPVNQIESLRDLVTDLNAGRVQLLVILGGNPVYDAPADFNFGGSLLQAKLRVHLGLYDDETAELCHWHVPQTHFLESWGDARAYDGTISFVQPLIAPLYAGKSEYEMLSAVFGKPDATSHDIVKDFWRTHMDIAHGNGMAGPTGSPVDFERFWEMSLHNGFIRGTAFPAKTLVPKFAAGSMTASQATRNNRNGEGKSPALDINFRPDPTIDDGRFANNGWLQELPKALTQLTWDNAMMLSPHTAQRLGVTKEDVVELEFQGRKVQGPVWLMPGHADECVTVHLGYGRRRAGAVGTDIGFNAYMLRDAQHLWSASGASVRKTGRRYILATTQFQNVIEVHGHPTEEDSAETFKRELVRIATLDEFLKNPTFAKDPLAETTKALSLYPELPSAEYGWAMVVDLNRCIGCNSCVIACQAENNIPVVGKHEVLAGRAMHWLRIDTYFRGDLENPGTYHEPVLCMHCENAPCEVVCPVGATVHSPEGLNEMVYNRCVGTRYCSNNCPYKVRRFNFKLYSDWTTPSLMSLRNPNVTVRSRGVMEKCTYCIQRIQAAKIKSEEENRPVRDGEISTACEAACPTRVFTFGNIRDPNSRVSRLKADPRNYTLLTELNTRPRTSYLAVVRNPNPEIKD